MSYTLYGKAKGIRLPIRTLPTRYDAEREKQRTQDFYSKDGWTDLEIVHD